MNLDTIFDHFHTDDEKAEAMAEFAALHPYGKEAAILSTLLPHKIADLLTLAQTFFRSGNEDFAIFYLDKYIQKNKETKRLKIDIDPYMFVHDDEASEEDEEVKGKEEDGDRTFSVYFCYDTYTSQDPITQMIIARSPSKYLAFNLRFETASGKLWNHTKTNWRVMRHSTDSGMSLFEMCLLTYKINNPLEKIREFLDKSFVNRTIDLEKAKFLADLFGKHKHVISVLCGFLRSGVEMVKLIDYSGKTPNNIFFGNIPFYEFSSIPEKLYPQFQKFVMENGPNLAKHSEYVNALLPFRHLFLDSFPVDHESFQQKLYHSLGLPPFIHDFTRREKHALHSENEYSCPECVYRCSLMPYLRGYRQCLYRDIFDLEMGSQIPMIQAILNGNLILICSNEDLEMISSCLKVAKREGEINDWFTELMVMRPKIPARFIPKIEFLPDCVECEALERIREFFQT